MEINIVYFAYGPSPQFMAELDEILCAQIHF